MLLVTRCSDAVDRLSAPFRPTKFMSDTRILNLTRNCRLKLHQAESRIAQGLMDWVEFGKTVRELDRTERLNAYQSRQDASQRIPDYLPILEPDGHKWEPPTAEKYQQRGRRELVVAARQFCQQSATQVGSLS